MIAPVGKPIGLHLLEYQEKTKWRRDAQTEMGYVGFNPTKDAKLMDIIDEIENIGPRKKKEIYFKYLELKSTSVPICTNKEEMMRFLINL